MVLRDTLLIDSRKACIRTRYLGGVFDGNSIAPASGSHKVQDRCCFVRPYENQKLIERLKMSDMSFGKRESALEKPERLTNILYPNETSFRVRCLRNVFRVPYPMTTALAREGQSCVVYEKYR